MQASPLGILCGIVLITGLAGGRVAVGAETGLVVEPARVQLRGLDSRAQVIVTAREADGRDVDATAEAVYSSEDERIARAAPGGEIAPVADGKTRIRITRGGRTATVDVEVAGTAVDRPVHFASEVVPILGKFGCNSGGCHGKATGQNGFRLSLLGFDPRFDHDAIVHESRGRRIVVGSPGAGLLLLKPTGRLPHGGGKKFEVGSPEYRTIERWIAQGARFASGRERVLTKLEVAPARRTTASGAHHQLRVVATFDDGEVADVTRLAQYQSNAEDLAVVDAAGRVEAGSGVGEAAIMARFGDRVAVARVVVPHARPDRDWAEPASDNLIDPHVFRKLRELGLRPSEPCTDAEFIRRASLDLRGMLPTSAEVAAFEADSAPRKRERLVDRYLDGPEYADYFAMKWSAILRNKRNFGDQSMNGSFAFHAWIRQAIAENLPYDEFVARIVAARGDAAHNPAVVWYRQVNTLESRVDDTAQLFLGMRIQCARCHHHPFERWSQADYYGFASLFSRIGVKPGLDPLTPRIYLLAAGMSNNPATGRTEPPKPLGAPAFENLPPDRDPRVELASWMRRADNPFFAPALVNRYWKHFFGRGLVEPEDDMRSSNPPSNPELLDALAADFVAHRFDLRRLVRHIATSKAYDRSSLPNESNAEDRRNFARFYARRLPAEVLLDAVDVVAGTTENFRGLPKGFRAVQLPDDGFDSQFLDTFGRPKRESVCECERSDEANLSQTLLLLNSGEIQSKLANRSGRATRFAEDTRSDAEKVDELYRIAYGREPLSEERAICVELLDKRRAEGLLRQGYEDLIWTLINTKEFLFNR
ncbi:MAG: DUF1549 and DUF1553 domain-containing protein [Isosphaeraceae bacterium]|nr:DUF1549 and DUF1553 domain-containing protein [Isosphaeraceae bacterium]